MKAGLRFGIAAFAAALLLGPAPALGQSTATRPPNTAPETVGPRELQNFSLDGTVTRQADTPPPAAPASRARAPAAAGQRPSPSPQSAAATGRPSERPPVVQKTERSTSVSRAAEATSPASSLTVNLAPPTEAAKIPAQATVDPGFSTDLAASPSALAPERSLSLWPWLLLAAVIGGAAGLLFWRRRSREAIAGGPSFDAFVAPEAEAQTPRAAPVPQPPAAPVPPAAPKLAMPRPAGLVSSNLRPWIELSFKPLHCVVEPDRLTLDFEVELFNSGGSPARDILVEACMFGAGPTQEQDIAAFFAKAAGSETPVALIAPLQRLNLRTNLVAARSALAAAEVGGQQMLVPVMAFNAVYRAGGREARTSVTYLLGRQTRTDKLAPFPAGAAPRAYTSLDVRPLPLGVRR